MQIDHRYWHSPRLGHDMGVAVFGHWGLPLLAFPTSHGDEWELERNGLIGAMGAFIDAGRVKVFCVASNNHESFLNRGAHPLIVFDREGNFYVAACYKGRHGVVRIEAETLEIEHFIAGGNVVGLCFTRNGEMIVATNDSAYSLNLGIYGTLL